MRVDKYLQVSRLVRKRELAKELCNLERCWLNNHRAKAGSTIEEGDILSMLFGNRLLTVKVLEIRKQVSKKEAGNLYEIVENRLLSDQEAAALLSKTKNSDNESITKINKTEYL